MRPAIARFITGIAVVPTLALLLGACVQEAGRPSALDAIHLEIQLEVRIKSGEGSGPSWSQVRELTVGPDGRIFTLHPREAVVQIHDATGHLVGTFGGRGTDPGEFKIPVRMGLVGERLWVLDHRANRLSHFDLNGRFLDTQTLPAPKGGRAEELRLDGILPDGTFSARPQVWSRDVAEGKVTVQTILRVGDSGEVIDSLVQYSLTNTVHEVADPANPQGFRSYRRQPFTDAELIRISAYQPELIRLERAAATERGRARFRVTKSDFSGETLFSREYDYWPKPLGAALVDSVAREIGEQASRAHFPGAPTAAQATGWARDAMHVPAFHPPVSEALLGRDGTVWLRRENDAGDVIEWAVLAADGRPLGTFAAPRGLSILAAEEGKLWGMETDPHGVSAMVRYAVKRTADARPETPPVPCRPQGFSASSRRTAAGACSRR